jgi:hypothetical protein
MQMLTNFISNWGAAGEIKISQRKQHAKENTEQRDKYSSKKGGVTPDLHNLPFQNPHKNKMKKHKRLKIKVE